MYFKDADNEISFKQYSNEEFEYLNLSRYNSPMIPLAFINEFLGNLVKKENEKDLKGFRNILKVKMIHIQKIYYIHFFQKYFENYEFKIEKIADRSYSLEISTNETLKELIHISSVLFLFLSMFGKEYLDVPDSMLQRYISSLQAVDAPFYIRNLFAQNFLTSRKRFDVFRQDLESTEKYTIKFEYGNTAFQRRNYIAKKLKFDKKIIDIGCGEGYYALNFANKLEDEYIAIDIEESLLERIKKTASNKGIENIVTYSSLEGYLENYNGDLSDVILAEVIEHMPLKTAGKLIKLICRSVNFENLIITTPNRDFNKFYEIGEDLRHDDHKWELGREDFKKWISTILEKEQFTYVEIGDMVDGITTTQGIAVKREIKVKGER